MEFLESSRVYNGLIPFMFTRYKDNVSVTVEIDQFFPISICNFKLEDKRIT